MIIFTRKRLYILTILSAMMMLVSCDKFSGDQTVPAYLHIEKISFSVTDVQGTSSNKITDAWVFVDGQLIGAFELPATFPVLERGEHTVTIRAGIKMNGIASTRVYYPFYKPVEYTVNFIEDSVVTLNPAVTYYESTKFVWMEGFEDGGSTLEKTAKSDTAIVLTSDPANVFEGNYSGLITLTDTILVFEAANNVSYPLSKGSSCFLEMNYKTNNLFTVGIIGIGASKVIQEPIVVLNHNNSWNKIYINLTSTIQSMTSALEFKVFLGAVKEDTVEHPKILLDNFKLLSFK